LWGVDGQASSSIVLQTALDIRKHYIVFVSPCSCSMVTFFIKLSLPNSYLTCSLITKVIVNVKVPEQLISVLHS
jgi:hypothetical protein